MSATRLEALEAENATLRAEIRRLKAEKAIKPLPETGETGYICELCGWVCEPYSEICENCKAQRTPDPETARNREELGR